MNTDEYDKTIARLAPVYRVILDEAKKGMITAPGLRAPTNRADGMTVELRKLCQLGLLRQAGRDHSVTTQGIKPMRYSLVAPSEVEKARESFATRKKVRQKRRASASRIPELDRKMVPGDFGLYLRTRKEILKLGGSVRRMVEMAFWKVAPENELVRVAEEIADLVDSGQVALAALELRAKDDKTRATIAKLREVNGRPAEEAKSFLARADKMEKTLDEAS